MSGETMQASPATPVAPVDRTLRLWPGLTLVACLWLARLWAMMGDFAPSKFFFGQITAPVGVLGSLALWWLFASRLRWFDRIVVVGALAATIGGTILIAGQNFPMMALIIYALPVLATTWVGWLVVSMPLNWQVRRAGLLALFAVIGVTCCLLRLDGMDGAFAAAFHWRWTPTGEAKLLSELKTAKPAKHETAAASGDQAALELHDGDWPAFRGAERDGRLHGVKIQTDWEKSPPKELWRHRIGPGWSSFAVVGNHVFTQEQRGEQELIVCYDALTGVEIWTHQEQVRFAEVVAGAGPRATPTFHEGRIYALGAKGTLSCLDAASGKLIWSKDIISDTHAEVPQWGFSSSPLVAKGFVSVFAGGADGNSVVAYDAESGNLAWNGGTGSLSYCSPQLSNLLGVEQVLITTETGLTSFEPTSGKILWFHEWPTEKIARIVQPAVLSSSDVLIGTGMSLGTRRISVQQASDTWSSKEDWTSRDIKPYYNDFVVCDDAMYGFDRDIFMCVGINDGKRKWRARGYGNGQVLLIADQKLLLILSETGDVALVDADPKQHHELARFHAITGKTWNHPVVAHEKLFVRNAEEVAAFHLTLLSADAPTAGARSIDVSTSATEPEEQKQSDGSQSP